MPVQVLCQQTEIILYMSVFYMDTRLCISSKAKRRKLICMSLHAKDPEDNTGQIGSQLTLTYTFFLPPGVMIAPIYSPLYISRMKAR